MSPADPAPVAPRPDAIRRPGDIMVTGARCQRLLAVYADLVVEGPVEVLAARMREYRAGGRDWRPRWVYYFDARWRAHETRHYVSVGATEVQLYVSLPEDRGVSAVARFAV